MGMGGEPSQKEGWDDLAVERDQTIDDRAISVGIEAVELASANMVDDGARPSMREGKAHKSTVTVKSSESDTVPHEEYHKKDVELGVQPEIEPGSEVDGRNTDRPVCILALARTPAYASHKECASLKK